MTKEHDLFVQHLAKIHIQVHVTLLKTPVEFKDLFKTYPVSSHFHIGKCGCTWKKKFEIIVKNEYNMHFYNIIMHQVWRQFFWIGPSFLAWYTLRLIYLVP